ncbi:amidohydrolase family protein [bacterium]|nr:amidohydrolase family protein [bacterium]
MKIDFHAHYIDEPDYIEKMLETYNNLGIDIVCISGLGSIFEHKDNNDVEEAFIKYSDRIIGFAYFRLGEDLPEDVLRFKERGFKALKMTMPNFDYDDERFFPVYEKAAELEVSILFHSGILGPPKSNYKGIPSSAHTRPIHIERIARSFPEINVICAHMGVSWFSEASDLARMIPNFYVDITGATPGWRAQRKPEFFKEYLWWEGAWDKVLFGTDVHYSEVGLVLKREEKLLKDLSLSEHEKNNFYSNNAKSILKL